MRNILVGVMMIAGSVACTASGTRPVTNAELLQVLGIQTWRLPIPRTASEQWSVEIADYRPLDVPGRSVFEAVPTRVGALVSLRPLSDDEYEFVVIQKDGASTGKLTVTVCESGDQCGGADITWEPTPRCVAGCQGFVVADLVPMLGAGVHKQLVLRLVTIPPESSEQVTGAP